MNTIKSTPTVGDNFDDASTNLSFINKKLNSSIEQLNKTCVKPWIKYEQLCLFGFNTTLGFQAGNNVLN